jgi:hypothetical protein
MHLVLLSMAIIGGIVFAAALFFVVRELRFYRQHRRT